MFSLKVKYGLRIEEEMSDVTSKLVPLRIFFSNVLPEIFEEMVLFFL